MSSSLPIDAFEALLPSLINVASVVINDDVPSPQHKQAVAQAANDFKDQLVKAKEIIARLPGGEMLPSDQDQVIAMLTDIRDRKRDQLKRFSAQPSSEPSRYNDTQSTDVSKS